jgi:hypothetical protein
MRTVEIKNLDDLDILLRVARNHFEKNGQALAVIKNIEESLTDAQRGYYWVLCGIIGNDLGYTKDEMHQTFKERFLLNTFINDTDNHPSFVGVVDNMKIIKERCPEQYAATRELILNGVSTMDATKANMMELLKEVLGVARNHQIKIPLPPRSGLVPDSEK